jgi:hypothetical protein
MKMWMLGVIVFAVSQQVVADHFYDMGYQLSNTTVESAWDDFGQQCHYADDLLAIVGETEASAQEAINSMSSSRGVEQFGAGYLSGLANALEKVVRKCSDECQRVGSTFGRVSATMFCATSRRLGRAATFKGLRDVPNMICGLAYSTRCQSAFTNKARNSCSSYSRGSAFSRYFKPSSGGCCSYTGGRYN